MSHEKETLENVIKAREYDLLPPVAWKKQRKCSFRLFKNFVCGFLEAYPDLKASTRILDLQNQA